MTHLLKKIESGFKTFFATIKNWLFLRFKKNLKLHLGAGGTKIKDFLGVDSLFLRNTDLVSNIKNLNYFIKRGSVSNIYASHVFEHFSEEEIKKILRILHKLLQKDGELRISVPDIDKIVKIYNKNWEHFQTRGHSPWNGLIYGGQSTRYDFHKTGFNASWLRYLLEEAGFKKIEEYNAKEFCEKYDIKDCSTKDTPFGELISLNMIAIK
ncbi:methyltransferase [Patescibacteria group bacterium]|nr:methyltransferase [Patescibacteria group bacterium]